MDRPLVSICTIVYNHENYIEDYIKGLLSQNYDNLELIVMDDCSTDASLEILRKYWDELSCKFRKCILIQNKVNTGIAKLSANADKLVRMSNGKYIKLFASDDIMLEDLIIKEVEKLEENPDNVLCHAKVCLVNDEYKLGEKLYREKSIPEKRDAAQGRDTFEKLLLSSTVLAQTAMFRKTAFLNIGGFDTFIEVEDRDLWLRLSKVGTIVFVDEVLACYRRGETSISNYRCGDKQKRMEKLLFMYKAETKLLKKHIQDVKTDNFKHILVKKHFLEYFTRAIREEMVEYAQYFFCKLMRHHIWPDSKLIREYILLLTKQIVKNIKDRGDRICK